jgi:hypothetical protein
MAIELLAIATTAAASTDIPLAAGESAHIHLRGSSPPDVPACTVSIDIKGFDNSYTEIYRLSNRDPSRVIDAQGVYRVRRLACEQGVGVDRD